MDALANTLGILFGLGLVVLASVLVGVIVTVIVAWMCFKSTIQSYYWMWRYGVDWIQVTPYSAELISAKWPNITRRVCNPDEFWQKVFIAAEKKRQTDLMFYPPKPLYEFIKEELK